MSPSRDSRLPSRTYPFVLHKGRRAASTDSNLIELNVEYHFRQPDAPAEIRFDSTNWHDVFGNDLPLRIEIGFGKSEFLLEVARAQQEFNYVGFEYSSKRVRKFLKKVPRFGVSNVRAVCANVERILERVFEPNTVDRFFILFPDPWPKRRHAKNRFVQPDNVDALYRLLGPNGGVTLRTDARHYAEQMLAVMDAHAGFVNLAGTGRFAQSPREDSSTLYEDKFVGMGRRIYYLEYEKSRDRGSNDE